MMRITIAIGTFLLACWSCAGLSAATVTVDKPTPPPCCVDGVCYPKVNTWGYYPGQWRRWPGDEMQPTPLTPTPAAVEPGITPFEAPSPQEEDRRAPTPTKPVERPAAQPSPPPPPTTAPGTATPGATPTPAGMPPAGMPPTESPGETDSETPQMPWDQPPTGEWDPPPALPFGTAEIDARPANRIAARPTGPRLRLPDDLTRRSSTTSADSPPSLPLALGRTLR
jgi:hypothetical protein